LIEFSDKIHVFDKDNLGKSEVFLKICLSLAKILEFSKNLEFIWP